MAPKADALAPNTAQTGAWFEAADNYQEEFDKAQESFRKIRDELRAKADKKDGAPQPVSNDEKFYDDSFPSYGSSPATGCCWYLGGQADDAADLLCSPHDWMRISDFGNRLSVFPSSSMDKKYTSVVQGSTTNGYLVEAMQAIGLREHLVKRLFAHFDAERGLYVCMLYKNACWVQVVVDDYIPVDSHQTPMCCTSFAWPSVCWPAIIEKAYAKRHGSYEGIGHGGSVVEALVDLTGGQGGQFNARDVSADRLFVYLFELQAEALFVCRVDSKEASKPGVRLSMRAPYVINRAVGHEGGKYLQLCCPGIAGGPFDEDVPATLINLRGHGTERERAADGFFWISVEQFQRHFAEIFECRLVMNDSLDQIQLPHQPMPRPLAMKRPHSHRLFATTGTARFDVGSKVKYRSSHREEWHIGVVESKNPVVVAGDTWQQVEPLEPPASPEFRITVQHSAGPTEIYLMLSQDCLKLREKEVPLAMRQPYVPMLVRVYQILSAPHGGCAKVAQSSFAPARDASVSFKATPPPPSAEGTPPPLEFLVRVTLPVGRWVQKLILRCDATSPPPHVELHVPKVNALAERHTWIEAKEQLSGFPLSFVGSSFAAPKREGDGLARAKYYAEGWGHPKGHHFLTGDGEGCVVQ